MSPKTATKVEHEASDGVETVEGPPLQPKPARGPTGFFRVAHPTLYPQKCVVCSSAAGPLIDTTHELGAGLGRLYVCGQCVKLLALELGLIDGTRMEELLQAGDRLDVAGATIEDLNGQIQKMLADAAAQSRKIEALEELLQQARDADRERRHLVEQQHEIGRQLLALGNG